MTNESKVKEVLLAEDLQVIKNAVKEMVNGYYRIQAEKDKHSDIVNDIKEKELLPPKMFRKLARMAYADSCKKENDELTEILDLAEGIGIYSHDEHQETETL